MRISESEELTRRAFIQRTAALSTAGAASSYSLGLAGIGELAAQNSNDGYKALVCVFLRGGNDHANTIIPYDLENHSRYSQLRGGENGVAISREHLHNSVIIPKEHQAITDNQILALSPALRSLKNHFDAGNLAPIMNVGPLIAPITKAQYLSGNTFAFPRPSKLFSHNDQQATWESFRPEGASSGWGGRIGDLALTSNQNAMFTAIGLSGNSIFLNGEQSAPFQLSPAGPNKMLGLNDKIYGSSTAATALRTLLLQQNGHALESDYASINARSIEYSGFIADALANAPEFLQFGGGQGLAGQLSVVARLIAVRQQLGVSRQVFLVSLGGFDTHSNLRTNHHGLLETLDSSLASFQNALEYMGLSKQVTTFTASDFGRTLTSNGNGSDHGWGGHHFVLGGAVAGGKIYGTTPKVSIRSDDQLELGRLIPSTSVDQYVSTLAAWFGVSTGDLSYISPNIGRFDKAILDFME